MPPSLRFSSSLSPAVWVWWLPSATLLALICLLGSLAWLVYHDIGDERNDVLIQDLLWLEQAMRMHFISHQDWATVLTTEIGRNALTEAHFDATAQLFLRENREVVRVERVDKEGRVVWHVGRLRDTLPIEGSLVKGFEQRDVLETARKVSGPAYSHVYYLANRMPFVDLAIPYYEQGRYAGVIRLSYGLEALLYYQVPWWIASKYQISIVDLSGRPLASKFIVSERPGTLSHEIEFSPPGYGLRLKSSSYQVGRGLALPVLAGGMALSLCLLCLSLWRVRQHIQRRHEVETALHAETALTAAMENSMTNGLMVLDAQGRIQRVNRACADMLLQAPESLVGLAHPYPFTPPDSQGAWAVAIQRILSGDLPHSGFELQFLRQDGGRIDVRLHASPLRDVQAGWVASFYDITELKKKREETRAAEVRLRTVLDGLDAVVCVTSCRDRALLMANRAFTEQILPLEHAPFCLVSPLGWGSVLVSTVDGELCFAGSPRWYQLHRRLIEWVDGEPAWLDIYADVTERKTLSERERQQNERLQNTARLITMGEMASSLAHELNQPLATISTYSNGCLRLLQQGKEAHHFQDPLEKIAAQAQRAAQIVRGIRAFVKKREPRLTLSDPAEVMASALMLTGPLLASERVAVDDRLIACPMLAMDPVMIEQVLINLIHNAVEAFREHGTSRRQLVVAMARVGEYVRMSVADNGPGIADDVVEQLFTPFFTTKQEGMGIGLNICRSIIEYHRGEFGFKTSDMGGACFWFTLPVEVL